MSRRSVFAVLLPALLLSCDRSHKPAPQAIGGVLDLRAWDFAKQGPVRLDGEWQFHSGRLVGGAASAPSKVELTGARRVFVPRAWNSVQGATGIGTYHLRVLLPQRSREAGARGLALRERGIYTAGRIFADGQLVGTKGVVGRDLMSSIPGPRTMLFALPAPPRGDLELSVEVSNFHYREGGIRKSIHLGLESALRDEERRSLAFGLFTSGALILMGLYHLFLYVIRPRDRSVFWLGLHCLFVSIRPLTSGESFLLSWLPGLGYHFHLSLEYVSIPLLFTAFLFFLRSLYPNEFGRWPVRALVAAAAVLVLLPFVLTTLVLSRLVIAYQAFTFASGLALSAMVALALYRRRANAGWLLAAGLVMYAGTVNDVLYSRGIIQTGQVGYVALLAFICTQAGLLSVRYAQSFATVEKLSGELSSKNEELTRLDRLKDEFLANASHELRTPLNGIIGISESLMRGAAGPLPETARQDLSLVASSGRRLTNLVNDILDFSKMRHGDLVLRLRRVDVESVVRAVLWLSQPLVADKPVFLVAHMTPALPPAHADEERLEQILHNLVGNAVKFTKQGTITVSAAPSADGSMIEVSVTDTGIGIPLEKQEVIFDSFTQADGSVSREYGGTGLGLSVSRRLVELHGGTIRVRSAPGSGARFTFTLPAATEAGGPVLGVAVPDVASDPLNEGDVITRLYLKEAVDLAPAPSQTGNALPEEPNAAVAASPSTNGLARVLIVDDDPVNLRVLRNHLSLDHYSVREASSGRAALELIGVEPFDLVLLDVMMPGLSGYEVCRIVRQTFSTSQLPVIMLTAKNRIPDLVAGLESGANDYLVKPFDSRELLARTRTMIEFRRAAISQATLASLQSELEVARRVQESLIPTAGPSIAGLDIALRYRAMEQVGGDYCDFLVPSAGTLGVFVGDVTGHGMPAALIVSLLKTAFYFQEEVADQPAVVMSSINRVLRTTIHRDFVTAAYAFIEPQRRRLVVANAGHPPLYVWRRGERELLKLRPMGRILGPFEDGGFQQTEVELRTGDRILLYTDGIPEAQSPRREVFGEGRFEAEIQELSSLSAADFADELIRRIEDWSGGGSGIEDDIALVVIDVAD